MDLETNNGKQRRQNKQQQQIIPKRPTDTNKTPM